MSNEVKIGILTIVAIALSFWGYKFIKGKNVLTKTNYYQVLYDNVEGMQVGTPVQISGVEVGNVASLELIPDDKQQVLVILEISPDIQIPKNTTAIITYSSIMGGKSIELAYDNPCSGDDCAEKGDFIAGKTRGLVASMIGADNLNAYFKELEFILQGLLDTIDQKFLDENSDSPIARTLGNLERTTASLESATGRVDNLLRRSSGDIENSLASLDSLLSTLEKSKGNIAGFLANADSLSGQLVAADLDQTLAEIKTTVTKLRTTLESADQAMVGITGTMNKINNGEGTLGKLINDEQLYNNLRSLSTRADSLVTDIQDRPYRYVPFKGRNKVNRYDRLDGVEN